MIAYPWQWNGSNKSSPSSSQIGIMSHWGSVMFEVWNENTTYFSINTTMHSTKRINNRDEKDYWNQHSNTCFAFIWVNPELTPNNSMPQGIFDHPKICHASTTKSITPIRLWTIWMETLLQTQGRCNIYYESYIV